ncbi:MAG: M20 family metallopeptidase [Armatimonadetes bacterium]|nr:M20 family metallopeptidase [Armatimonadota bacterium]
MTRINNNDAAQMLSDLIAIPSANPMGRPFDGDAPVERGVTEYMERLFVLPNVHCERQAVSAAHENLIVRYPAGADGPRLLFESHMDVVPADEWADRAFVPWREGDLIYGRGACDDKGSLAAMALALLDLIESGEQPPRPVMLVCAGDEEYAQTGIKAFRELPIAVAAGVFGEPTGMAPVVQHKGTLRWDITVHGKSAHTSRPELGVNAIHGAMDVIAALRRHQDALQARHTNPLLTGPMLTVSMIRGGRTRNAVPDECTLSLDFRLLPGMDMEAARADVVGLVGGLGWEVSHSELQLRTPPLSTSPDDPFCAQVLGICRRHAGEGIEIRGEPYGTDASWIADRAPAVVLGPGDIRSAHAVDEQIDVNEVVTCASIYRRIMASGP